MGGSVETDERCVSWSDTASAVRPRIPSTTDSQLSPRLSVESRLSTSRRRYHMETHSKPMILCVDDDAINHMVLETFFKPHGFAIEVAMSGFEVGSG